MLLLVRDAVVMECCCDRMLLLQNSAATGSAARECCCCGILLLQNKLPVQNAAAAHAATSFAIIPLSISTPSRYSLVVLALFIGVSLVDALPRCVERLLAAFVQWDRKAGRGKGGERC